MIPRTFHQVWIGPKPVPERFKAWAATWTRHNPGWELALWTDRPAAHAGPWTVVRELPPLINAHLLPRLPEIVNARPAVAAMSDMIRYEIVAREGGVYLDTDCECFRPCAEVFEPLTLFCADECGGLGGWPGNYLFGATPGHPAMWTVVRELADAFGQAVQDDADARRLGRDEGRFPINPVVLCGPQYLNRQLQKHADAVLLPWPLFNPLPAGDDHELVRVWPASAYGNHHFAGTWYDRKKKPPADCFLGREPFPGTVFDVPTLAGVTP
jgi:hypothetical protein